ncbi:MAG: hypothetical protein FWG82_00495 [Oscillospiraceae bacterium]|nr:hypothetical protein [Oscillospiraceae bacterium]
MSPKPKKILYVLLFCIAAVILLVALGVMYFAMRTQPEMYWSRVGSFTRRDSGTGVGFNPKASMFHVVNNIGSDGKNKENATVTFRPKMQQGGDFYLYITYASGSSDRYFDLSVNGVTMKVPCPGTNWDRIYTKRVRVELVEGQNELVFGNADWYAPNLDSISIGIYTDGAAHSVLEKTPVLKKFKDGEITLELDTANGVYSIYHKERLILDDAYVTVSDTTNSEENDLSSTMYSTHTAEDVDGEIRFIHEKAGFPTLVQTFTLHGDYLLTKVAAKGISANRIAPVETYSAFSLLHGTHFLEVPFDNDDYASFNPTTVDSVSGSYEMTALINAEKGDGVVIGSVTHDTWKTGIQWEGTSEGLRRFSVFGGAADMFTRDTIHHGVVSGDVTSPTIMIGAYDKWQDALESYGRVNAQFAPPLQWDSKYSPMGWSSWGAVQSDLTREIAYEISDYYKEHIQPYWQEDDEVIYINLDAGWGNALPDDELKKFVDHCAENGQKAGVYYTPFACWKRELDMDGDPFFDALLRDNDGNILPSWDGAIPFDPTHPLILEKFDRDLQRYIDAGVGYIKLDFVSHGAMEGKHYRQEIQTGIQAYNFGMKYIADKIDGQMFINHSIAPIFPHQYANGRRIACDTFFSIQDTQYMLNSLTYGFWQREIYPFPDPDHILVYSMRYGTASEGEARARVLSGAIMASFLAGDWFTDDAILENEAAQKRYKELLRNPEIIKLIKSKTLFTPVDFASYAANVYTAEIDGKVYFAVFNFDDENRHFSLPIDKNASLIDLWNGEELQTGSGVRLDGVDGRVYLVE